MADLDSFLTARKSKKGKKGGKKKVASLSVSKDDKKAKKSAVVTLSSALDGDWADSDSDVEKKKVKKKTVLAKSIGDLGKSDEEEKEETKMKNLIKPEKEQKKWKSVEEVAKEAEELKAKKEKEAAEKAKQAPVNTGPSTYVYKPSGVSAYVPRASVTGKEALKKLDSTEYFPTLGDAVEQESIQTQKTVKVKKKVVKEEKKVYTKAKELSKATEKKQLLPYVPPDTEGRRKMLEKCRQLKEERKDRQMAIRAILASS